MFNKNELLANIISKIWTKRIDNVVINLKTCINSINSYYIRVATRTPIANKIHDEIFNGICIGIQDDLWRKELL